MSKISLVGANTANEYTKSNAYGKKERANATTGEAGAQSFYDIVCIDWIRALIPSRGTNCSAKRRRIRL